jgi:hypothetical protein
MASREEMARELMLISVALGRVAAFRGIGDASPTVMMVDELVRDHEELEARIDAAMMLLKQLNEGIIWPDGHDDWSWQVNELARLLQGGARVPETPEDLEGHE